MGGNPIRQGGNHTTGSNLGLAVATQRVKRRKQGSRVIRHYSPEIT